MRERSIFLYIVSLVGIALSFAQSGGAIFEGDAIPGIIAVLAAVVLVSVALLLNMLHRAAASCVAAACAFIVTAWFAGPSCLPLAAATALAVLAAAKPDVKIIAAAAAAACFVCALVFRPEAPVISAAALLLGFSVYALWLLERHEKTAASADISAGRAEDMRTLLGSQRRVVMSTEHVSRLEERNRLAARIHDEIGHGMSGSILLLEGAELVMDKEPEKARKTIRMVAENLCTSVEKIRGMLREERSSGAEVSLARIEKELTAFETYHPQIKTRLDKQGDMGSVSGAVWLCIYENMTEALTNMLKHSRATLFRVDLKNSGGLLRVEFSDNGGAQGAGGGGGAQGGKGSSSDGGRAPVEPGMGLQNMEERAALCYGRCFFRREPDGFHIIMTFPRREY